MPAEEAFYPQDVGVRGLESEPLAEQLCRAVSAERARPVLLVVRPLRQAVEDEVGAVVDEDGAGRRRGSRQRAHTEGIAGEAGERGIFGAIDVVVSRAIDDRVGRRRPCCREHRGVVADIEL